MQAFKFLLPFSYLSAKLQAGNCFVYILSFKQATTLYSKCFAPLIVHNSNVCNRCSLVLPKSELEVFKSSKR